MALKKQYLCGQGVSRGLCRDAPWSIRKLRIENQPVGGCTRVHPYNLIILFRVNGYGAEAENLDEPGEDYEKRKEADGEIERRLREGETYKTIQRELGVTPRDIAKVSKKIRNSV